MPALIKTVEEIIATQFKRQGYWIVFNRTYNDVHAFGKSINANLYLNPEDTDEIERSAFLSYMQTHFPDVATYPVFDSVSLDYLIWPYLGSIAIDMDKGDAVYAALSERYNDPELDGNSNHAVLWTMLHEHSLKKHQARMARIEAEFADPDAS